MSQSRVGFLPLREPREGLGRFLEGKEGIDGEGPQVPAVHAGVKDTVCVGPGGQEKVGRHPPAPPPESPVLPSHPAVKPLHLEDAGSLLEQAAAGPSEE